MLRILVADDAPSVRKLLRLILEPAHVVIEAGDGDDALRQLIDQQPDLAILDVMMPARNGLDVCRQVRQDPRLAAIGLIVLTANGSTTDRATALAAGADQFVSKPFSPGAIVRLVQDVAAARGTAEPVY